jgi:hypothetical protein
MRHDLIKQSRIGQLDVTLLKHASLRVRLSYAAPECGIDELAPKPLMLTDVLQWIIWQEWSPLIGQDDTSSPTD